MTPHLDDEALSALLDGEAAAAEETHVEACPVCTGRLAQLRAVALAVGVAPEPVTDARRDTAIAAALAVLPGTSAPAGDRSPPLTAVAGAVHRQRRWARLPQWAAAAAVVAVLAGSVGVVTLLGGQAERQEQATAGRSGPELADEAAAPDPGTPDELPVDGGDLGALAIAGVDDLARQIDQKLAPPDAGAFSDREGSAAPSAADAESDATDSASFRRDTAPCEAAARDREPALGRLLYTAGATVNATPASVLGFQVPGADEKDPATVRVLALALATCTELASASA